MFILSKIVGILTDPVTLFVLVTAVGTALGFSRRWAGWGRRVLVSALIVAAIPSVLPLERWFFALLENRFPAPQIMPEHVDGIIVLGGAVDPVISEARGQITVNSAVSRLTSAIPLVSRYPDAKVIFTGGSGAVLSQGLKEATYVRAFYQQINFDAGRIVFEDQSRNTRENAVFSKQVMTPRPGETWLLVTSASHMPRAVGCFRAVGWPVIAYPTDYQTTGRTGWAWSDLRFSPGRGLLGLAAIWHELLGLVSYRILGWSSSVLPSP